MGSTCRGPTPRTRDGVVCMSGVGGQYGGVQGYFDPVSGGVGSSQWISATTRHVHIFSGSVSEDGELYQNEDDKLTVDVDPDSEFQWTDEALQKVFDQFDLLVANYAGAALTDYTLRLIGSELEHFIRRMLQKGEIKYNLGTRAVNFSMGIPQVGELPEGPAADP